VIVEFDLTNAQVGLYTVEAVRSDACGATGPYTAADAFELVLPALDANPLGNGDFETGFIDPWVASIDEGAVNDKNEPMDPPQVVYAPIEGDPWFAHYPYAGIYMAGERSTHEDTWETWDTPNNGYLTQSIGLPNGPGQYDLTLAFYMRIWDQVGGPVGVTASIIGDFGDNVSSMTVQFVDLPMTIDGCDPYTLVVVDFSAYVQADITIELYFYTKAQGDGIPGPDWGSPSSVVVDNIVLYGISGCNVPFADTDGDGDVDGDDFGQLQLCLTGSGYGGVLPEECLCLDHVQDGSIDQADRSAFEDCATGPDILHATNPNPNCDEQP
jgi:hypothetical protein